jgi:hypothetical protein
MKIRAKMLIQSVTKYGGGAIQVNAMPVAPSSDDNIAENERFHRYTPGGELRLHIDNPPVAAHLEGAVGRCLFVDMELVPAPAKTEG